MDPLLHDQLKYGETLFGRGRMDEAEECFIEISKHHPENTDAYNNLGVIAFHRQEMEQALEYFTKALRIDPFHKNAIINCSFLLKNLNRLHEIRSILAKAVEKFPDDQELSNLFQETRPSQSPSARIAVVCLPGLQSFLGDIVDFLGKNNEIRTCYSNQKQEIETCIHWADTVWLEWANELAIELTQHSNCLDGKRVLCRLHSYEAFNGYADKIVWEKISDLIFVAEHIKNIVVQQVPNLLDRVNVHVVPNGVNLDRFPFTERSRGTTLAYLGNINYKKGPMLLLHAFRELVRTDGNYQLHIAGNFQDPRYAFYFSQMMREMGLEEKISVEGWVNDVPAWLEDKQYIVCTSVLEGHPVGLMEAMACGIKPLIHNYVGARGSYPSKYLWNTIPEFVRMATENEYRPGEYRQFIERNYSSYIQLKKIEHILNSGTEQI